MIQQVAGTYQPLVLDLDGSGVDDVVWYGPGSAGDALWLGHANGAFTSAAVQVKGTYKPFTG